MGEGASEHERLQDLGIGTWCLALALGIFARSYLSKVRACVCVLVWVRGGREGKGREEGVDGCLC
jgi:hypothetical protein